MTLLRVGTAALLAVVWLMFLGAYLLGADVQQDVAALVAAAAGGLMVADTLLGKPRDESTDPHLTESDLREAAGVVARQILLADINRLELECEMEPSDYAEELEELGRRLEAVKAKQGRPSPAVVDGGGVGRRRPVCRFCHSTACDGEHRWVSPKPRQQPTCQCDRPGRGWPMCSIHNPMTGPL